MRSIGLGRSQEKVSVIGQGTWGLGGYETRDDSNDEEAVEALQLGIKQGMMFIDTAEIYGDGHSEELVGKAIESMRSDVFIATKIWPNHFSYDDVLKAAKASIHRLRITSIDLYQLHWPNPQIPIQETMKAMEKLVDTGTIRYIGVSNFSVEQLQEAQAALSQNELVSNQVEYNLLERGIEQDLLPYCQKEKITVMAYRPLERGRLITETNSKFRLLDEFASKYDKSRAQIALNWLISKENVMAIPKAIKRKHIIDNSDAAKWSLKDIELQKLDDAFK